MWGITYMVCLEEPESSKLFTNIHNKFILPSSAFYLWDQSDSHIRKLKDAIYPKIAFYCQNVTESYNQKGRITNEWLSLYWAQQQDCHLDVAPTEPNGLHLRTGRIKVQHRISVYAKQAVNTKAIKLHITTTNLVLNQMVK